MVHCGCDATVAGRQKNKKKLLKERIAEKDERDKQLQQQQQQQAKKPVQLYILNHKKRDILFLTITLANVSRFL